MRRQGQNMRLYQLPVPFGIVRYSYQCEAGVSLGSKTDRRFVTGDTDMGQDPSQYKLESPVLQNTDCSAGSP